MPMAKTRRASSARISARKITRKGRVDPRKRRPIKRTKRETRSTAGARTGTARTLATANEASPLAPAPKPTYHEAVAMYERGLQALQRRDFATSAAVLRNVIERYPDERELLERARLYLKVCERELEPKAPPAPKTADEWVYGATVSLNEDNEAAAVQHLRRALETDPRHDHAHYMMAVASMRRGDPSTAIEHLHQAIVLNPDNRSLARQDPDFDALRDLPGFRAALDAAPAAADAESAGKAVAVRPRKPRH